jgi:3-hydroxyisobutyrate dehydrogenase-like beta-hydroxyacid dehydrogenase
MTQTIGFIGLGLMGRAFVARLREVGHRVVGFDIDAAKIAAAEMDGMARAAGPADVASRADLVLVCVVNTAAVEDVVKRIVAAGRLDGRALVDLSTTEIEATCRLAARLQAEAGMTFVDAPVSGGPDAARTGTLAIMAGGPDDVIRRIEPVMQQLGRFTHMGPVGTGQATKLVNQTIVLSNYCVLAEALRLAEAHGVDTSKIPDALGAGFAGSNLMTVAFPRMVARDFAPRGYARQVLKDLELLQADARAHHLAMPMASQALTLFRLLVASGQGDLDAGAVVTLLPEPSAHQPGSERRAR